MKQRSQCVLLLLFFLPFLANAQKCEATLCGTVTDAETGQPIGFAEVFFEEINVGTVTDEAGKFHFHDLCEGTYTLVSRHIGCPHVAKEVEVKGNVEVNFSLSHEGLQLDEILVKEKAVVPLSTQTERILSGPALDALKGQTLGDALKTLPGVSTLSTGSSIVKPVIRGLHSNRVLMLNNGVRQEGQQWGLDHGPEIDPYLANELTVVMGANSVRYGSDALGGVILVEPKPLREMAGVGGEVNLAGFSNGRSGVVSGMMDGKLDGKLPLSGRLQGTIKRGGNMRTPEYFLQNTGVKERNASAMLGLEQEQFDAEVFYSLFYTDIGILEDAHIGNLTDLQNAIERGRPLEDGAFSYTLDRPLQRVVHHLFKATGNYRTGDLGELSLLYARQFNRRQEFDAHKPFGDPPEGFTDPEMEFEITTHSLDLVWTHRPVGAFTGSFGAQWMQQVNTTDRGGLIPDYRSRTLGVFWIERWRKYPIPIELEAGLRYDHRHMDIEQRGSDVIDDQLNFSNLSGTFGAIYHFSDQVRVRFNLGTAWRAPSVNELYSDGVHHGSASFEKGREDLTAERAFNTGLSLDLSLPGQRPHTGLTANLSLYRNVVNDFIYLEPQENPVLTIRGAFPSFRYNQTDARLTGLDWNLDWKPVAFLGLGSGISLLRARNLDADEPLVFMPSDRFRHSLSWYPLAGREGVSEPESTYLRFSMQNVLKQTRVPEGQDFAPPPSGFTLFDLEGGFQFRWQNRPVQIGIAIQNLFNTSYREYLNRLRYYAGEAGRNVTVRAKIEL